MSKPTIERLYTAFQRLDGDTMAACYAPAAQFSDPVFTLDGAHRIGAMWRMLAQAVNAKGRDVWKLSVDSITDRSAHWEAHYRFSTTGRMVHNIIEAQFEFDPQGLILRHVDRFDFWRWSRQALGPAGTLLGWTPLLHNKVRAQAAANLERWIDADKRPILI